MIYPKANIVVVDDTRANLHLLNQILTEAGYQIRPIPDGERVLKAVEKSPPDLILLDIMMPGLDGYSICEKLHANQNTRDIPIIFTSALSDALDKVKAFEVGGVDYITKPFQKEEILARIENQLTIQRQKHLLTSILNSSLNGIMALEAIRDNDDKIVDFRWLMVNSATANMFKFLSQNIVGENLIAHFPGVQENGLLESFITVVEANSVLNKEIYYDYINFRGWLQIVGMKLGDGLVVTFCDITSHKKLELTLQAQANIDGLTGIANRRLFDHYIQQEWQQCYRKSESMSLILCDVDYFKLYNDHYGHQKGDECLKKIAKEIEKSVCRPRDLAARYGGEEFVIVLPTTNSMNALQVANAIKKNIQRLQIRHEISPTSNYVTISMGVTTVTPAQQHGYQELIASADQALYKAKKRGRNTIEQQTIESRAHVKII
ncbi:diguanylate cyclase domain-containing protein [Candidatus Uabimicrobium sp. HlEnr_7]|uniref:diguanylate cyclase domain-containing protein n=1 Tax=Candidatus Uabimicrobium helgolandensis TaxID=3095367 RepID=UPI0035591974